MRPITFRLAVASLCAASTIAAVPPVQAQDAAARSAARNARALASTCANCHGTDGNALTSEAIPPLKGMAKADMIEQMQAFRDGKRPATVMHQIAKGFSAQQVEQIATYFASLR